MKRLFLLIAISTLASGCATTYQQKGFTGGFSETQLRQDVYRVSFNGNAYTNPQRAADFTLLRSAELTKKNGYSHFVIINADNRISESTGHMPTYTTPKYTTPTITTTTGQIYNTRNGAAFTANSQTTGGQTYGGETYGGQEYTMQRPSSTNTIQMFRTKPAVGFAYDAAFIIRSLSQEYELEMPVSSVPQLFSKSSSSAPRSMGVTKVVKCGWYMKNSSDDRLTSLFTEAQKTITDTEFENAVESENAVLQQVQPVDREGYIEYARQSCVTLGYDM